MSILSHYSNDFEAVIRIFSEEEGGRKASVCNGIRWDFAYASDDQFITLYMIYPDFYDQEGRSLPEDQSLPTGVDLPARMFVLVKEMRDLHRQRIRKGVRFYCHEGSRRVAEGVVTQIAGLLEEHPDESR